MSTQLVVRIAELPRLLSLRPALGSLLRGTIDEAVTDAVQEAAGRILSGSETPRLLSTHRQAILDTQKGLTPSSAPQRHVLGAALVQVLGYPAIPSLVFADGSDGGLYAVLEELSPCFREIAAGRLDSFPSGGERSRRSEWSLQLLTEASLERLRNELGQLGDPASWLTPRLLSPEDEADAVRSWSSFDRMLFHETRADDRTLAFEWR